MKNFKIIIVILIILLFNLFSFTYASNNPQACGLTGTTTINLNQRGGLYRTAQGTLRVLVVFVRFKDDNAYNPHWPAGSPPNVMNNYIDPNANTNSTNLINLTHYFDEMSMATYHVIGDAIYVETPHNKSYYGLPDSSRSKANKDVLQNVVDPLVDFSDYDNWTFNSDYSHTNQPDGTVDMIIMVWRGLVFSSAWLGEATLGYGSPYTVENGTKIIKNGFGGNNGSGFTAQDWGERSEKINFHTVIHEFGHWLLGGNHPYSNNSSSNEHAFWGMLHHSKDGICANAYERERLAWINPTEITSDIINAPINDYLTTGVAYKYHPVNGASNEYYYFENHQKLSIYDDATENNSDKGIFVLHFEDAYSSQNNLRCKTADGQWNWSSTGIASCFGGSNNVRKWKMTDVNRTGNNHRDKLEYNGTWDWIWSIEGKGCAGYPYGANSNEAFNLTYNNVFSPKSNPCSATWNNIEENFTMEVTNQSGSIVNVRFYLTNPYGGSPSKPQNLNVVSNGTHPLITWDANTEPDLNGYKLYRSDNGSGFFYIATLNSSTTSYVDNDVTFTKPIWDVKIEYKVKAKDTQNKYSVYSNSDYIYGKVSPAWKKALKDEELAEINSYSITQNYPNPFNPTTTLSYQLPKASNVVLKVYDVLGKEVIELVNENKSAGVYNVTFDASNLPSGVYIYKLQAGEFSSVKKMLLIK